MSARLAAAAALSAALAAAACKGPEPFDYGPYLDHMPRSILVLPPTNETVEVAAPYGCLSTVTAPLGEQGYYVLPVAMVDAFMKENGCPTPNEMHAAPPQKLREVFGADAALYLHVRGWGTQYQLINSQTSVVVDGRLVDLRTGMAIWAGSYVAAQNSSGGQNSLLGMAVSAIASQIFNTTRDAAHELSVVAMPAWFADPQRGLLTGPRSAGFEADQAKRRLERATRAAAAAAPKD